MKVLTLREPWASLIGKQVKTIETRRWPTSYRGELYIDEEFAAKTCKENSLNYDCGDYTVGRYAWILKDIEYINPIPAVGHLSIWNYNPEG